MAIPNPLRSITLRLNTTPVEELPRYARFLASSILDCADVLQQAESQKGDAAILLHKLKTRITSLLQDKTSEGRFTGIVLAKAVVDAGQAPTLAASGTWLRAMLSCLNKQDPPEVKKLCLVALTRILLMTDHQPTLIREITMPILPSFITATLTLVKPPTMLKDQAQSTISSPLLHPVLQCWLELLQHFPSTFRPFLPQIKAITSGLVSDEYLRETIKSSARKVLIALHFAAPKNTASAEWSCLCQQIIDSTHGVADRIFRSIVEEWTSASSRPPPRANEIMTGEMSSGENDMIGFRQWTGLQSGCTRAVELLHLLQTMLTSKQAAAVNIPVSAILDLTARFTAVTPNTPQYQLRTNSEIGRDEREEMWLQLPRLHAAVLDILRGLLTHYKSLLKPVMPTMLSQLWSISDATAGSASVRARVYETLKAALEDGHYALRSAETTNIASTASSCCADLRAGISEDADQRPRETINGSTNSVKMSSNLVRTEDVKITEVYRAAWDLLPLLFESAAQILTAKSRAEMDATTVLIGHEKAMLSSILHPSDARGKRKTAPSLLPFLARVDGGSMAFDALTRPRMPVVRSASADLQDAEGEEQTTRDSTARNQDRFTREIDMGNSTPEQSILNNGVLHTEDELLVKKRDFAEFEQEQSHAADVEQEALKRARTDPMGVRAADKLPSVAYEQDEAVTTALLSLEPNNLSITEESTPVIAVTSTRNNTISEAPSTAIQSIPNYAAPDDSDDDEIPTIDTTLTSESEDEEMDES